MEQNQIGRYMETCRFYVSDKPCSEDAKLLVAWQPVRKSDGEEIMEEVTNAEVNAAVVAGTVDGDWTLVCKKHLSDQVEKFRTYGFPAEANEDFVYIAELQGVTVIKRQQIVPETIEVFTMVDSPDIFCESCGGTLPLHTDDCKLAAANAEESPKRAPRQRATVNATVKAHAPRRRRTTKKTPDADAPWGYRADGVTPRKKPGRKVAESKGA